MRKRSVIFGVLFLVVILSMFLVVAEDELTDTDRINNAHSCLEGRTNESCSALRPDTRAFSLLTVGQCQEEIEADMINSLYWSNGFGTSIKYTAQSVLALDDVGGDVSDSVDWLLDQNKTADGLDWFLEIDAPVEEGASAICEVGWSGGTATVTIENDRTLTVAGGSSCLSASAGIYSDYYVKIDDSCLSEVFTTNCDKSFLTTLLFKKQSGEGIIHVAMKSTSMAAGESTTEQVNSLCFAQGSSCDYEGSLWAAMVLKYFGEDVSSFMPYLIVFSEDSANTKYFPESFLYSLTSYGDFRNDLILKQTTDGYWDQFGDIFTKYYDTGIAGLGLPSSDSSVDKAKQWLFSDGVQSDDGCWGSTLDTAILLYSFWGDFSYNGNVPGDTNGTGGKLNCITSGYYCLSPISCVGLNLNENYQCAGMLQCCSLDVETVTCFDEGGVVCSSDETCSGSTSSSATDLSAGQSCCIAGSCQTIVVDTATCVPSGGICRVSDCLSGETKNSALTCAYASDPCCVTSDDPSGGSYWWIFVLLGLIILVILGIVFRDKLRILFLKIKSKFGGKKKGPTGGRPGPRGPPMFPQNRPMGQRKILPPSAQRRPMPPRRPMRRPQGEVDDVLKKLKDMGQ